MRTSRHTRTAFTLVELLVVLVIIAVLMTIGLVIGARARTGARVNATLATIKILDSALTELQVSTNGLPKPLVKLDAPSTYIQVIADATGNTGVDIDSCSWFVYQASKVDSANKILEAINPKYVVNVPDIEAPGRRSIIDAFGKPIRYVHPAFQGVYPMKDPSATFGLAPVGLSYKQTSLERRSTTNTAAGMPNSDGGQCSGNRPYFYSAGEDGKPDTRDDNIYSESGKPTFVDG